MLKDCERRMYGKELYEIKLSVKKIICGRNISGNSRKKLHIKKYSFFGLVFYIDVFSLKIFPNNSEEI